MKRTTAVTPYAKALFSLAKERNQTDAVARELDSLGDLIRSDDELRDFFARPWVTAAAKRAVAGELATRMELSPLLHDFLLLTAANRRAHQLDAMAAAFANLVDRDLGRVRARVRTAVPLTASEKELLSARISRTLEGKQVLINEVVDEQLLGGFVAEIDSLVLDGSLDGQLARMRERLAKG